LLTIEAVLETEELVLQQESWFGGTDESDRDASEYNVVSTSMGTLYLIKNKPNITYPQGTYADLLLSNFTVNNPLWNSGVISPLTEPTAKLDSTCKKLAEDNQFDIVHSATIAHKDVRENYTCSDDDDSDI
jgi:hypothetical protein